MLHMHGPDVRMQTSQLHWLHEFLNMQLRNCVAQLLSTLKALPHAAAFYLACEMRAGFLYQRAGWASWAVQDSKSMVQGQPCHCLRTCPD